MPSSASRLLATRHSLLERLPNLADQAKWQEFFNTYWRLIYGVARKAGLNDAEAQDVVQEAVVGVVRNIEKYDAKAGSFKSWLLQLTRWRIVDQLRKRGPEAATAGDSGSGTALIERVPDPASVDACWEDEWRRTLLDRAMERVKQQVKPKHFQVFDCAARKHWSAARIAETLNMNIAQVYLIKHRVAALVKKEVALLESKS